MNDFSIKILNIKVKGLKMFENDLELKFLTEQRMSTNSRESVTNIFKNFYINNVCAFTGLNASGKTLTLKLITFVIDMIDSKKINESSNKKVLIDICLGESCTFEVIFKQNEKSIVKLVSTIKKSFSENAGNEEYYFDEEYYSVKPISSIKAKKDIFDFDNLPKIYRKKDEMYLQNDVSFIGGLNKLVNKKIKYIDLLINTNLAAYIFSLFPTQILRFLDPSIEYISTNLVNEVKVYKLKFFTKNEITLTKDELTTYLSTGTTKGIDIFLMALYVLSEGGYYIIDEIESNLNKEIVSTLIRFFNDSTINKKGAVLIFSTHYVEIIDILERNDSIFVTTNKQGIKITNLNTLINRNDYKRSDLLQNGTIENTSPSYSTYLDLKKYFSSIVSNDR
ncbi:MAG: AAA family ATPase [Anaeroplasmataceae bacterium]